MGGEAAVCQDSPGSGKAFHPEFQDPRRLLPPLGSPDLAASLSRGGRSPEGRREGQEHSQEHCEGMAGRPALLQQSLEPGRGLGGPPTPGLSPVPPGKMAGARTCANCVGL